MMRRAFGAALALIVAAGAAWADTVTLKNGQKITGWAREEGNKIVVEMALGTVSFCKEDVVSIEPGRTLLHDYKDKADAIKESKDAKDFIALSKWARDNGLTRYARPNLEHALLLDPNNDQAHRALGHSMYKGKWMTDEEVKRDQGYVWFEGRWMTALEQQLIIRKRLAVEEAKLAAVEEKKRKKEMEREARRLALQDYYDQLVEEARVRQLMRNQRRYGYGPYRRCDAIPVVDVVGYLQAIGWSLTPTVPSMPSTPSMPAPGAPSRPPGFP